MPPTPHPPRALLETRVQKAQAALAARGLDAVLVTGDSSRGWLSGITTGLFVAPFGAVVVTRERAVYLASPVDYEDCRATVAHLEVIAFRRAEGETDLAVRVVAESGARSVLLEAEEISAAEARRYEQLFREQGIEAEIGDALIAPLRAVKDAWEVEQIREANRVNAAAFAALCERIRPGVSEWELAVELEHQTRLHGSGSTRTSFLPVVASGPRSALPHTPPTDRRVERGDFVKLDFGATWNGYASDNTRTVVCGKPADWQRELHAAVLAAQEASIAAIRPGASGAAVHEVAADVLRRAGFGDYFIHGLGHGVGIQLPDAPMLSPQSRDILQPGHIMTVEPGAYLPGRGGVRIEDNVVVTDAGNENLSTAPKGLMEL